LANAGLETSAAMPSTVKMIFVFMVVLIRMASPCWLSTLLRALHHPPIGAGIVTKL
jgi:hypothetical protein